MKIRRPIQILISVMVAALVSSLAVQVPRAVRARAADDVLFSDDFSNGDLSAWSSNTRFAIDPSNGSPSAPSAAMETVGQSAQLVGLLAQSTKQLCATTSVNVLNSGGQALTLLRLRADGGQPIVSLKTATTSKIVVRSDAGKVQKATGTVLTSGWHRVGICGVIGADGTWSVSLDGATILSGWQADTGTRDAAQVVIGDTGAKTISARWDAVNVTGSVVAPPPEPAGPVIAAAGNIACDPNNPSFNGLNGTNTACRMRHVSNLLVDGAGQPRYETVLALGDNQYVCGGHLAYETSYGPTWGRVYDVTKPVVGDKDYRTTLNAPDGTDCTNKPGRAAGFFEYFDSINGVQPGPTVGSGAYYSFNVPAGCSPTDAVCWHVIALNGNCRKAIGCEPGTPQYSWLQSDLAAHAPSDYACTIAFWHWPRFSSGKHGSDASFDSFWRLLYQHDVEIVLNAHEHVYERFAPQNPSAVADPARGIRQFTVGTGGASHVKFPSSQRLPTSQASNDNTFGILTLTLGSDSYTWRFIPEAGGSFTDASAAPTACH